MGKISKIKIGESVHDVKDALLTERVGEVDEVTAEVLADHEDKMAETDEVAAAALCQLNEQLMLAPLTEEEVDNIFAPEEPILIAIYTENFAEYDADDWASDNGYDTIDDYLAATSGDDWLESGCQKFTPTELTFEYDGQTYQLWNIYTCNAGETDLYGMMPMDMKPSTIIENSMKADSSNRFNPFYGCVNSDEFYDRKPEGEWSVLEATVLQ